MIMEFMLKFNVDIKLDDNGDALATYTIDTHVNDSYSVRYFTFNDPYQDYEWKSYLFI